LALKDNLEKYEDTFGEVKFGQEVHLPMNFGGTVGEA